MDMMTDMPNLHFHILALSVARGPGAEEERRQVRTLCHMVAAVHMVVVVAVAVAAENTCTLMMVSSFSRRPLSTKACCTSA